MPEETAQSSVRVSPGRELPRLQWGHSPTFHGADSWPLGRFRNPFLAVPGTGHPNREGFAPHRCGPLPRRLPTRNRSLEHRCQGWCRPRTTGPHSNRCFESTAGLPPRSIRPSPARRDVPGPSTPRRRPAETHHHRPPDRGACRRGRRYPPDWRPRPLRDVLPGVGLDPDGGSTLRAGRICLSPTVGGVQRPRAGSRGGDALCGTAGARPWHARCKVAWPEDDQ